MALLKSYGIGVCTSIPTHIPTEGQARLFRLENTMTFYYYDGVWKTIIIGDDAPYNPATWNGNLNVPTKNVIRDIIETLTLGGLLDGDYGHITVSGGGTVWTVDPALPATVIADGSVSNAAFEHLTGVTQDIQPVLTTLQAYTPTRCFRILSSQFGGGSLTHLEITNTFGVTPTSIRTGTGVYQLNIPSPLFVIGGTLVQTTLADNASAKSVRVTVASASQIIIETFGANGNPADIEGGIHIIVESFV